MLRRPDCQTAERSPSTMKSDSDRILVSGAMPRTRQSILQCPADCIECAQNAVYLCSSKQKRPRRTVLNYLIYLKKSGAGDGIRTHDPNLGKVVLYP